MTLPEGESDARPNERDRARSKTRLVTAIARAGTLGCAPRGGLSCGNCWREGQERRGGVDGARVARACAKRWRTVGFSRRSGCGDVGWTRRCESGSGRGGGGGGARWWGRARTVVAHGGGREALRLAGYIWVRSLVLMTRWAQKSQNPRLKS